MKYLEKKKTIQRNMIGAVICLMVISGYIVAAAGTKRAVSADYQSEIAEEILRLHVIANSDTKEDQALKMKVKERIVTYVSALTKDSQGLGAAQQIISLYLEEIKETAQDVIREEGYQYPVTVELADSYFPIKTYGEAVFPEGIYHALKIKIGNAEGKNWWCVLYPNLCFVDSAYGVLQEEQKEELKSVLTEEEYESIFQVPREEIKISFKLFSMWE